MVSSKSATVLVLLCVCGDSGGATGVTSASPLSESSTTAVVLPPLSASRCVLTAKMEEVVGLFGERGVIGSICEPDYGPFFQEAVGIIDAACDQFVPPG
jgi:hypothetical protein